MKTDNQIDYKAIMENRIYRTAYFLLKAEYKEDESYHEILRHVYHETVSIAEEMELFTDREAWEIKKKADKEVRKELHLDKA